MRNLITTLLLALLCGSIRAQETLRYNLSKYATAQGSYGDLPLTVAPEDVVRHVMRRYPSLVARCTVTDSLAGSSPNLLAAEYLNIKTTGPYLHYNGNHTVIARLKAIGEMPVKGMGTLYGRIVYDREKQSNTYQNYAIYPEDYAPYLVYDTISVGNFKHERYLVEVGVSIPCGATHYGISGFYEGIASAQETQPRRSVYTSWFKLGLSVSHRLPEWLLAAKVSPEINRQAIGVSSVLQTYKFLQSYGFGLYNKRESTSGYTYRRQAKILGIGTEVMIQRPADDNKGWNLLFHLSHNYRWMQAEEVSYKNLYASRTQHLTHTLTVSKGLEGGKQLYFLLQGTERFRSGIENIYENRLMDASQNLYDYVMIGKNQLYKNKQYTESFTVKTLWNMHQKHAVGMSAGIEIDGSEETYVLPQLTLNHLSAIPSISMSYQHHAKKDIIDLNLWFKIRRLLHDTYPQTLTNTITVQAQTAIPHLIRTENNWCLGASLIYAHQLSVGKSIGCKFNFSYLRRTDTSRSVPVIYSAGAERYVTRFHTSLFYLF